MRRYAFAIPDEPALDALARHAPIVELGAGTGYWTHLLHRRGVDSVAYDVAPPDRSANPHQFRPYTWTVVDQGGVDKLALHPDRTLFLCWPGYRDAFADQALAAYAGTTLVYVGEARGGHTANDPFFERLERNWRAIERVAIPCWPGTSDALTVYRASSRHAFEVACSGAGA